MEQWLPVLKKNYHQVLLVFAAFIIMVLAGHLFIQRILSNRLHANSIDALNTAEANVRSSFAEAEVTLLNAVNTVLDMLASSSSGNAVDGEITEYLKRTTRWILSNSGGSADLYGMYGIYGIVRGTFIDSLGLPPLQNFIPQTRPWYQTAVRSGASVAYTPPYRDERTGNEIISAVKNIIDEQGEIHGILVLDMNMSWLGEYAKNLRLAPGGYGMIISQYMNVMFHQDESILGRQLQEIGGDFIGIAHRLRLGQEINGERIKNRLGLPVIAFFRPIYNGWYLGILTPPSSYYRDLYLAAIILVSIGFALALLLSYVLLHIAAAKLKSDEESRAKSSFLAQMSHEIRTPMNAIIGIAQMQLQSGGLSEKQFTAMDKIYSSGHTLLGIINDILDFSKIETGKLELALLEYDVPSLINDAVQLNIVRIGSKPLEFVLDIDENLPSTLYGDELRLKQILNNLLSNAIKYTAQGSVKLSVAFEGGPEPETITLIFTVADTGQGMKQKDLSRLFSEYARFNTEANRGTEGTGLGLNITQKLVSMMKGAIGVESEYGKGSIFTVRIIQKRVNTEIIGAELAAKLCSFTFNGAGLGAKIQLSPEYMPYGNVLVVDDVETNLYVAEGLLSPYGLHIETVTSGFAALDKVKAGSVYDIIFLDHMMPEMDGIQTCAKIRETGYSGVIAALTANAIAGNDKMFKEKGFDDFISKPIDIRQLDAALNKYVRGAHRDEAEKVKTVETPVVSVSKRVYEAFKRDAKKAVLTLRETAANGDIKLFTTTAHGMKSALASIGQTESSALAKGLEEAGKNNDTAFITENAPGLINALESLLTEAGGTEPAEDRADIAEDRAFLSEKLAAVIAACGEYNNEAALSTLETLLARQWKAATKTALTEIKALIFSDSDFDLAKEKAESLAHWHMKENYSEQTNGTGN